MPQVATNNGFGIGRCRRCDREFRRVRRKQVFCSLSCHDQHAHNPAPKFRVTRVVEGADGGYAFSVSENGGTPVGGYFIKHLKETAFVSFPAKLVMSVTKKARLSRPLAKQVVMIVQNADPRFHPNAAKPTATPIVEVTNPQPTVQPPAAHKAFRRCCPHCDVQCSAVSGSNPAVWQCPKCGMQFENHQFVWKQIELPATAA